MRRKFTIEDHENKTIYALFDDKGILVSTNKSPRVLSRTAFDMGAQELCHNEDLILVEERAERGFP